jgi:DNA invertase Pin-like site-specific DNA recombinase
MAAEPGPDFRWGVVLRRSKLESHKNGVLIQEEESTDNQEYEVVYHIRDNNMGVIVESYKDIASAWKPGAPRPRFKHALVDLASGAIDGIAVLNVDRLTRRRDQVRPILNALEEMGGRLFSLEDELDTADDSPDSNTELRLHELVARAEREARRTSQRYKLMAKYRARKGLPQPGPHRPFGHTADWCNLVPHEAELINEAALRVVADEPRYRICRDWTSRGIPTTTGVTRWHNDKLTYILTSARLIGKREYDGTLIDMPDVPPILPEGLWRQVQEKLAPRANRRGRREGRQLSNIATCGPCGLTLIGDSDTSNGGALTYVCKKRPAEPGACGGVNVLAARVDALVDERVVEFLNDKRRVETLLQRHRLDGPEMDAIDARFAELQDNKLALEEAAFNPPAGMKRLPRERYWELRTQIEQEQERLQRRRVVNREAEPLKAALKQAWTVETWRARPLEHRRVIIRLVTERIEVMRVLSHGAKKGQLGEQFDPERVRIKFAA